MPEDSQSLKIDLAATEVMEASGRRQSRCLQEVLHFMSSRWEWLAGSHHCQELLEELPEIVGRTAATNEEMAG